ncbi:MAG: hypothetical protein WAO21_07915 [Verrucomicrobiia bacterium]
MEPERKIEKLLRAYAKKRRADAGDSLKLHPANRRILLGEAARRAPRPDEGGMFLLLLAVFRRRLVFVLSVLAIITVGTALLLPALNSGRKKAPNLGAMNNLKEISMATRQYAGGGQKLDGLQSNALPAYSLADKNGHAVPFADGHVETATAAHFAELTNQKSLDLALADQRAPERLVKSTTEEPAAAATPASVPFGATAGSLSEAGQTTSANGLISGESSVAVNARILTQNQSSDRLTTQTNSAKPGLAAAFNFVQAAIASNLQNLFRNASSSAQNAPVLQSFQMQQNGNAVSVVDRDGSVYNGSVQLTNATALNEPAPAETPAAPPQVEGKMAQAAGNKQQTAQNYFFRVTGTNRTLKQNVVFTGNFLANTIAPQTAQPSISIVGVGGGGGGGAGNQLPQNAANQSQQSQLSNSRIVGTAVIASTNQIEIDAVPVTQ